MGITHYPHNRCTGAIRRAPRLAKRCEAPTDCLTIATILTYHCHAPGLAPSVVGVGAGILGVRMRSSTLVVGLWLSLFVVGDVHAYLDPGAGSIVLQAIIAAVAGGFIVMRTYWSKVKQLFTRRKVLGVTEVDQPRD